MGEGNKKLKTKDDIIIKVYAEFLKHEKIKIPVI